jgi:hypothetical protein
MQPVDRAIIPVNPLQPAFVVVLRAGRRHDHPDVRGRAVVRECPCIIVAFEGPLKPGLRHSRRHWPIYPNLEAQDVVRGSSIRALPRGCDVGHFAGADNHGPVLTFERQLAFMALIVEKRCRSRRPGPVAGQFHHRRLRSLREIGLGQHRRAQSRPSAFRSPATTRNPPAVSKEPALRRGPGWAWIAQRLLPHEAPLAGPTPTRRSCRARRRRNRASHLAEPTGRSP